MEKEVGKVLKKTLRVIFLVYDAVVCFLFDVAHHFCEKAKPLPPIQDEVLLMPAVKLAERIRKRQISSFEAVSAYIKRVQEVHPLLNAVIDDRFEDALEEARKVDEHLQVGGQTQDELLRQVPFLGVPFTTKDSVKVKGLLVTAGLYCRKNEISDENAESVRLMIEAGAIPICITNVPEMCMWYETYHPIYGLCKNPYNSCYTVGGSSGGEGCLLGSGASVLSIGTDIGGSIRMPCFFNGVFGHKPTTGIVSNKGKYPPIGRESVYLSTGPMCRYADDLAPMLKVLAGPDAPRLKLDDVVDLSQIKIYYMMDNGGEIFVSKVSPELKDAMKKVIAHFHEKFDVPSTKVKIKDFKNTFPIWSHSLAEVKTMPFCKRLSDGGNEISPLKELALWVTGKREHTIPALCFGAFEKYSKKSMDTRQKWVSRGNSLRKQVSNLLGENGVLLYHSHPEPAFHKNASLFRPLNFTYTAIFNTLGFPATQCPLGLGKKCLPLGIQVVAGLYNDKLSIAVAREIEHAFGGWISPCNVTC